MVPDNILAKESPAPAIAGGVIAAILLLLLLIILIIVFIRRRNNAAHKQVDVAALGEMELQRSNIILKEPISIFSDCTTFSAELIVGC